MALYFSKKAILLVSCVCYIVICVSSEKKLFHHTHVKRAKKIALTKKWNLLLQQQEENSNLKKLCYLRVDFLCVFFSSFSSFNVFLTHSLSRVGKVSERRSVESDKNTHTHF